MPTDFDVAPDALTAARADTARAHDALAAALGDVRAEVTSLVGDGWRGAAAAAFEAGFDEWRRGAEQVLDALTTTEAGLDATRVAYESDDAATADAFARLGSRLGDAA